MEMAETKRVEPMGRMAMTQDVRLLRTLQAVTYIRDALRNAALGGDDGE